MSRFTSKLRGAVAAFAAAALLSSAFAAEASAEFGFEQPGGFTVSTSNQLAGAHSDLVTHFSFNRLNVSTPDGTLKGMRVKVPPGFVGNPEAFPRCEVSRVIAGFMSPDVCPRNTVVGMTDLEVSYPGNESTSQLQSLIYNVIPEDDQPAAFAFGVAGYPIRLDAGIASGDDYRVMVTATGREEINLLGGEVTFWGVPADHTGEGPYFDSNNNSSFGGPEWFATRVPFMSSSTECSGQPQAVSISVDSWMNPGVFVDAEAAMPPLEKCEDLPFEASMTVNAESHRAGVPSGYVVDLKVPQINTPDGRIVSHLKDATVTLPQGVTLSPGVANGLSACPVASMEIGTDHPEHCPGSSKIGTVEVTSDFLPAPVSGDVFVGERLPGNRYRMLLAFEGYGLNAKVEGIVSPDPVTGQLTSRFVDNPQLPFNRLRLEFKGGPNAVLVNPPTCGPATMSYQLKGWSGAEVSARSSFQVDEGCGPQGFAPKLNAGTTNPVGGKSSPFSLRVTRQDGEQNVARVDVTLPEGVLAKLAGVPLCPDAQAATGDCSAASQIGTTTVGLGVGSSPLYVPQPGKSPTALYLAGPYKGAPYSLVVKVPAQAGPFDLGTVTVRSAINIDPVTTRVSVKSDPLPQIHEGIPLTYRDIRVDVNRPDFMLNPTSCDPMSVAGQIGSVNGASADVSSRFQVGDCAALGFKPKLAMRLFGPTHRSAHPKLRATMTAPAGHANINRVAVTLPKTEFLENSHIRTICTRVQYAARACPEKSVYGYAKVWTPLLDQHLEGPVYLRSSDHQLPDLVASLNGPIRFDLAGRIDSVDSRIRTTFEMVPDAPVSKFVLIMQGGKKGLLVNNTELCETTPRARARFEGQNGKIHDFNPVVKARCGAK
jgi:hypothetical protein